MGLRRNREGRKPIRLERSLLGKIADVVTSGRRIAIVGWKEENHNRFTLQLRESDKVLFYASAEDILLPRDVGITLFTSIVSTRDIERLHRECCTHILKPSEITEILLKFEKLILSSAPIPIAEEAAPAAKPKKRRRSKVAMRRKTLDLSGLRRMAEDVELDGRKLIETSEHYMKKARRLAAQGQESIKNARRLIEMIDKAEGRK